MKSLHCIPIRERDWATVVKRARREAPHADTIEITMGEWPNVDAREVMELRKTIAKPLLIKSEPPHDFERLEELAACGIDTIDLPASTPRARLETLQRVKSQKTKLILSFHDFKRTPTVAELERRVLKARAAGADIVKIATTVIHPADTVALLNLLPWSRRQKIPLIVTAMGPASGLVRMLSPLKGSVLYFAPLTQSKSTADGQLTRAELEALWKLHP